MTRSLRAQASSAEGCVHLGEILAAAGARRASLVPETSGYLALAIADAAGRLPFRIEDAHVLLTTEGSVSLTRRGAVVEPREAGAIARSVLARLLSVSIGRMPGLSSAARPRSESDLGVEGVARELEAALIPVNRAAARRALARLARETLRAKEDGALVAVAAAPPAAKPKRRSRRPFASQPGVAIAVAPPAPLPAIEPFVEIATAPERGAMAEEILAGASEPEREIAIEEEFAEPDASIEIVVDLDEVEDAAAPVAAKEPTPTARGVGAVGVPSEILAVAEEPPTAIDPLVVPVAEREIGSELELDARTDLGTAMDVEEMAHAFTHTPPPAPLLPIELGSPFPALASEARSWVDDPRSFETTPGEPVEVAPRLELVMESDAEAGVEAPPREAASIDASAPHEPPAADAWADDNDNDDEPTRRTPTPSMIALLRRAAKSSPIPESKSSSRVDELLATFGAATHEDASVRAAKASLKAFVGLDPTPPPPTAVYTLPPGPVVERAPSRPPAPPIEAPRPQPTSAPRRAHVPAVVKILAALAFVAIAAALVVRYQSELFAFADPSAAAAPPMTSP